MSKKPKNIEYGLVAHAGGAWHGLKMRNCLEAFERSCKYFKIIELDVCLSLDGHFIVAHSGWSEKLTQEEFLARTSASTGTRITLPQLLQTLREHPEIHLMLDWQHDYTEPSADKWFEELLGQLIAFQTIEQVFLEVYSRKHVELCRRFVPQLECIYGFQKWKKIGPCSLDFPEGIESFVDYCKSQHLKKVSIAKNDILIHPDWTDILHSANISVFSYCWNSHADFRKARAYGVDWITTDWLMPNANGGASRWRTWGSLLGHFGWKIRRHLTSFSK